MSDEVVVIDGIEWTSIEDEETLLAVINGIQVEAHFYGMFWMAHAKKKLFGNGFMSEVVVTERFADKSEISASALKCIRSIERAELAMSKEGLLYGDE